LLKFSNVIVTPHNANNAIEALHGIMLTTEENS
jgi:phosphoglycerate dehydrogenase-like enzyme